MLQSNSPNSVAPLEAVQPSVELAISGDEKLALGTAGTLLALEVAGKFIFHWGESGTSDSSTAAYSSSEQNPGSMGPSDYTENAVFIGADVTGIMLVSALAVAIRNRLSRPSSKS